MGSNPTLLFVRPGKLYWFQANKSLAFEYVLILFPFSFFLDISRQRHLDLKSSGCKRLKSERLREVHFELQSFPGKSDLQRGTPAQPCHCLPSSLTALRSKTNTYTHGSESCLQVHSRQIKVAAGVRQNTVFASLTQYLGHAEFCDESILYVPWSRATLGATSCPEECCPIIRYCGVLYGDRA